MKIIYIGDLHVKSNKYHKKGLEDFFIHELYPLITELEKTDKVVIVLLGDEFDTSSPDWDSWIWLTDHIKKWPQTFVVTGNHSVSLKKGNATLSLNSLHNVTVFDQPGIEILDNLNLVFFPYPTNSEIKESYQIYCEENLDYKKKYVGITHFASTKNQFSENEGIDLNLPNDSIIIEGHTHISAKYKDSNNLLHYTVGVPIPTRKGEESNDCQLLVQDSLTGKIDSVKIDQTKYFTYETLVYPDQAKYLNSLITVVDIPLSDKHLWRKEYEGYGNRIIGHKMDQSELEVLNNLSDLEHNDLNLNGSFSDYAKEKNESKKVIDNCFEKINMSAGI